MMNEKQVEKFLKEYPKGIEDARKRLGKLFDEKDYPDIPPMRKWKEKGT